MRQYEHREQENGEVRHEYEFILVDGCTFSVSIEKVRINLVREQF